MSLIFPNFYSFIFFCFVFVILMNNLTGWFSRNKQNMFNLWWSIWFCWSRTTTTNRYYSRITSRFLLLLFFVLFLLIRMANHWIRPRKKICWFQQTNKRENLLENLLGKENEMKIKNKKKIETGKRSYQTHMAKQKTKCNVMWCVCDVCLCRKTKKKQKTKLKKN